MSVKRILCLVLSVLLLANFATVSVSAIGVPIGVPSVRPQWNCTSIVSYDLSFEGSTAYVYVHIIGSPDVNRISTTVQLYRQRDNGTWEAIGDSITHLVYKDYITVVDTVPNLPSGNYQAVLMATVSTPTLDDHLSFLFS